MATLSAEATYAQARAAGFSASQAVIMTAIAIGESGLKTTARGDTTITTGTWGPSIGLWQVRTLKPDALAAASGADRYRNAAKLTDPAYNAKAAYAISGQGKTFKPWSVYTSGAYKTHLSKAKKAAQAVEAGSATVAPVAGGKITTAYGKTGSLWSSGAHTGVDYAVPTGTKVVSTGAGTVTAAGKGGGAFGTWVKVKLANGYEAIYGHLSSAKVKVGQKVTAGQQVGLSGATGNATGPHLHYEVRKDGTPVNPTTASFLPAGFGGDALDWLTGGPVTNELLERLGLPTTGDVVGGALEDGAEKLKDAIVKPGEIRDFMTKAAFVVLGVGLVVIGANRLAAPAKAAAGKAAVTAVTKGAL